mmetsp:Transcript_61248/g.108921  ORF Transcript_61248/g.108921 Transcript_61248/m.108921 type:complete len:213 (-) Transcript_61248:708-1346(-)
MKCTSDALPGVIRPPWSCHLLWTLSFLAKFLYCLPLLQPGETLRSFRIGSSIERRLGYVDQARQLWQCTPLHDPGHSSKHATWPSLPSTREVMYPVPLLSCSSRWHQELGPRTALPHPSVPKPLLPQQLQDCQLVKRFQPPPGSPTFVGIEALPLQSVAADIEPQLAGRSLVQLPAADRRVTWTADALGENLHLKLLRQMNPAKSFSPLCLG